jgi:hypothetical protein
LLFIFSLFAIAAIDIIGVAYGAISTSWLTLLITKITNKYASYIFPKDSQNSDSPILRYPEQLFRPKSQIRMRAPANSGFGFIVSLAVFIPSSFSCLALTITAHGRQSS